MHLVRAPLRAAPRSAVFRTTSSDEGTSTGMFRGRGFRQLSKPEERPHSKKKFPSFNPGMGFQRTSPWSTIPRTSAPICMNPSRYDRQDIYLR